MATPFRKLAYADPTPVPWLMDAAGVINHHLILPHVLRVRAIDLPPADAGRLTHALDPGAAAFVAPNHPEFTTDWMLDKEISRRFAPRMAHWAAYDIVNASPLARRFWLGLHLIANVPDGGGRAYSVRCARAGNAVLLHPEGTATWCGDRLDPLVPGIAEMALATFDAERRDPTGPRGAPRPVRLVPVVWKLRFERDVSRALGREIDLIARTLNVERPAAGCIAARFAALHETVLEARYRRFGMTAPRVHAASFFEAQAELERRLTAELARRHGPPGEDRARWLHRIRRSIARASGPAGARLDLEMTREVDRLMRFDRSLYGGATLAQEQIAESLKRLRSNLLTRGCRHALHHLLPRAAASRIAHVRVPEPLDVADASPETPGARERLMETLAARMGDTLAALGAEIAPSIDRHRRPNPWHGARPVLAASRSFVTRRTGTTG